MSICVDGADDALAQLRGVREELDSIRAEARGLRIELTSIRREREALKDAFNLQKGKGPLESGAGQDGPDSNP